MKIQWEFVENSLDFRNDFQSVFQTFEQNFIKTFKKILKKLGGDLNYSNFRVILEEF